MSPSTRPMPRNSSTARLADKGTTTGQVDPAVMRRTVSAVVALRNCRRSEARERISAWLDEDPDPGPGQVDAWLQRWGRWKPTEVAAIHAALRGDT